LAGGASAVDVAGIVACLFVAAAEGESVSESYAGVVNEEGGGRPAHGRRIVFSAEEKRRTSKAKEHRRGDSGR